MQRLVALLAATAVMLVLDSAAAQTPVLPMPNDNQTAAPLPDGTLPSTSQTAGQGINLPRADGTITPAPPAAPGVPSLSPLCKPTTLTANCNPIPNPSCLPGQITTPAGQECPSPVLP
jgi:hypothetical protein